MALKLIVAPVGDHARRMTMLFNRDRGGRLVGALLNGAGYTKGLWKLKIHDKFSANGRTPAVQVRGGDPFGKAIVLWLKPKSNASGVKCLLFPPTKLKPDDVLARLKEANRLAAARHKHAG